MKHLLFSIVLANLIGTPAEGKLTNPAGWPPGAQRHTSRSLATYTNSQLGDLHWQWNLCQDAYWSDEENVCQQDPNGVNGYHFITVKSYNSTSQGGTCQNPTNPATVTCNVAQSATLVVLVFSQLFSADTPDQTYADAKMQLEDYFNDVADAKVYIATVDGKAVEAELVLSEDWFVEDVAADGCTDNPQLSDGTKLISLGYWLVLPNLSGGEHEIVVSGGYLTTPDSCAAGIIKVAIACNFFCSLAELPLIGWFFRIFFGLFGLV